MSNDIEREAQRLGLWDKPRAKLELFWRAAQKAARTQGVTAPMKRIAEKKLDQMGATVHGVLVRNEAGAWAAVSEAGRVMWLHNFEGQDSNAQPKQPCAVVVPEDVRERLCDALSEALGDALDCMRVWSAWGVGTMSQNDFQLVTDDPDRIEELVDAALSVLTAAPTAPAVQGGGVPVAWMVSHPDHAWRVYDAYPSWAEGEFEIEPLYTHPHNGEQGGEWLSFDERLPAEADYMVWYWDDFQGLMIVDWKAALMRGQRSPVHNPHWMPAGLTRPQPPKSKEGE